MKGLDLMDVLLLKRRWLDEGGNLDRAMTIELYAAALAELLRLEKVPAVVQELADDLTTEATLALLGTKGDIEILKRIHEKLVDPKTEEVSE
jgi:hypothetical protein